MLCISSLHLSLHFQGKSKIMSKVADFTALANIYQPLTLIIYLKEDVKQELFISLLRKRKTPKYKFLKRYFPTKAARKFYLILGGDYISANISKVFEKKIARFWFMIKLLPDESFPAGNPHRKIMC